MIRTCLGDSHCFKSVCRCDCPLTFRPEAEQKPAQRLAATHISHGKRCTSSTGAPQPKHGLCDEPKPLVAAAVDAASSLAIEVALAFTPLKLPEV